MKILGERFILAGGTPRIGGMAEIHQAVDQKENQRRVAVKLMTSTRVRDDRIVREAFNRELKALTALDHPNIVKIVDFDSRHDPPYLVLEWLEHDLASLLGAADLHEWDEFYRRVGGPILDALVFAATHGFFHRDLKPANVLVDDEGILKVSDFGISKYGAAAAGGLTLAQYGSEPYAPLSEGLAPESRDPYSFAVLALRCITGTELKSHEDVAKALAAFQGPAPIGAILTRALAPDVSQRFPSVLELKNALDAVGDADRLAARARQFLYVFVLPTAVARLCERVGKSDEGKVRRLLERDIVESLTLSFWIDADTGKRRPREFNGRTSQFRLHMAVDDRSNDKLMVLHVWPQDGEPGDSGFRPPLTVTIGRPPPQVDGVATIRWLLDALEKHEVEVADDRRSQKEEELLREWSRTLGFRQSVEEGRYAPIIYTEHRVDGNRVYFKVPFLPEGVHPEQPRMVRTDQGIAVAGVVDEIRLDGVALWVEHGAQGPIPREGQLLFDNRASRVAIDRQKHALDAVRYGRSLRPKLRDLLLNPASATPPKPVDAVEWAHPDFDDDKKMAVRMALASDDVLVVQGPPGTGKTRFITELVVQILRRTPDSKILLTSQTHVALDNVLERLRELQPATRMLRVAQRDDERVSPKVHDLLVDRVAARWRAEIEKASEEFLASMAKTLGVRRDDIALGMAAGRLRAESAEYDRLHAALSECETTLAEAELKLQEARAGRVADDYQETSEALEELREQVRDFNERRKSAGARKRDAAETLAKIGDLGQQLATADTTELAEWERGLLDGNEADRKCHALIRLAEDWQLRFAASREFYPAMVVSSSVVAGTCLGFARVPGMLSAEFDVCIVDEASKATATEILVSLSRSKRWVLVGDPKQLPPFVEDLLDDPDLLDDYQLDRQSFQTTLLDRFIEALPKECVASLTTQHRMIKPIGDLVSECFYDGNLNSVRDERELFAAALPAPVTWFTTARLPGHHEVFENGTYKNVVEARIVGQWLRRLAFMARTAGKRLTVGVISAYAGQCVELQRTIAKVQKELGTLSVECNTVDAFQGREADICVYSVTRCNDRGTIGFLRDVRRMNVALSRGRVGLVIVGDHQFCRGATNPNPLHTVLDYIERHPRDCKVEEAIV